MAPNITREYGTKRENKGKSIISFPKNYVMIDIETTGLDPRYNEIIELSALRVKGDEITESYTQLVRPISPISSRITSLTGITNEMLKGAAALEEVLSEFIDFIGEDIVIGYSVHFDVDFIYDAALEKLNHNFSNDFVDVLRIARRIIKTTKNHKLKTIADYFEVSYDHIHRGEADNLLCLACFKKLRTEAIEAYNSEEYFISSFNTSGKGLRAGDIPTETDDFDTDHPLFQKECVFTGTLSNLTRREAMQIVANCGGINRDSVTRKTSFLILGDTDYTRVIDGKSSKLKKAEKYKCDGQEIEIISEKVFYDLLV